MIMLRYVVYRFFTMLLTLLVVLLVMVLLLEGCLRF